MTSLSAINDTGYSNYPVTYTKCHICGSICRRLHRHMNKMHKEVARY